MSFCFIKMFNNESGTLSFLVTDLTLCVFQFSRMMSNDSKDAFRNVSRKPGLQIWTISVSQDVNMYCAITASTDVVIKKVLFFKRGVLKSYIYVGVFLPFLLFSPENATGSCFS